MNNATDVCVHVHANKPAHTYFHPRCEYHPPGRWNQSALHFLAHQDCPFMLQPTLSTEGDSLKIYTAHGLMNQRETGWRADEGRGETDERGGGGGRGGQQEARR